jgi:hypothetical protein
MKIVYAPLGELNNIYSNRPTSSKLCFALSSMSAWRDMDIDFSHVDFYSAVVSYFEVTPGPVAKTRVDDLLDWWNRSVIFLPLYLRIQLTISGIRKDFGRTFEATQVSRHGQSSSVLKLAAQRKARKAATSDD